MNRSAASQPAYASVLAHFDLAPYSAARGRLAVSLADMFGAHLIGAAAVQTLMPTGDASQLRDENTRRAEEDVAAAERHFLEAVGSRSDVEWRTALKAPDRHLLEQARAADILVIGRRASYDHGDATLGISPGYVVMECGRPVIVVPPETDELKARTVVVAWKDTREARRAVYDSLPLLVRAEQVVVASATSSYRNESAEDVVAWLAQHGVNSRPLLVSGELASVAEKLLDLAGNLDAGLIVSGAYGHTRTREWIFGGVTRDLLETTTVPLLISH